MQDLHMIATPLFQTPVGQFLSWVDQTNILRRILDNWQWTLATILVFWYLRWYLIFKRGQTGVNPITAGVKGVLAEIRFNSHRLAVAGAFIVGSVIAIGEVFALMPVELALFDPTTWGALMGLVMGAAGSLGTLEIPIWMAAALAFFMGLAVLGVRVIVEQWEANG